jgi:hypothetical protein
VISSGRRRSHLDEVIAANRSMALIELDIADPAHVDRAAVQLTRDHPPVPIDIGHTDTGHTTCVQLPSIGLVIAGDAIYSGTHPYLVESNRQGLGDWLAAIDKIEALNPLPSWSATTRSSRTTPRGIFRRRAATPRISFAWMMKHEPLRSSTIGCPPFIRTGSIRGRFGAAPTPQRPHAEPTRDSSKLQPRIHNDEGLLNMHAGTGGDPMCRKFRRPDSGNC